MYQVVVLGASPSTAQTLTCAIQDRLADLGLAGDAVAILWDAEGETRNRRLPTFAIVFGDEAMPISPSILRGLLEESVEIAPVASVKGRVREEIPAELLHINVLFCGSAGGIPERLTSLIFESFRLLRRERKLFISYKRDDSERFANLIYEEFDKQGFDVFIDTRSVPPAVDFQETLWHRLSDADVVVLIDTKGFRAGRWTTEELARANATNIQILHLLWPGQTEDAGSAFSHFMRLAETDFADAAVPQGGSVRPECLGRIRSAAENLRARAIAARHRYLTDGFCDAARDLGGDPAVQPERWISLQRSGGGLLAVIPAVGVPSADKINEIYEAVQRNDPVPDEFWVIYDNRGVMSSWMTHLDWLDSHLPIRAVKMAAVMQRLGRVLA